MIQLIKLKTHIFLIGILYLFFNQISKNEYKEIILVLFVLEIKIWVFVKGITL